MAYNGINFNRARMPARQGIIDPSRMGPPQMAVDGGSMRQGIVSTPTMREALVQTQPQQSVAEILSEPLGEMTPNLGKATSAASRQREIADMLLQGAQQQDNTSIAGGLSQLGQAFLARKAGQRADKAEAEAQSIQSLLVKQAMGGDQASIAQLLAGDPAAAINYKTEQDRVMADNNYRDKALSQDADQFGQTIGLQRDQFGHTVQQGEFNNQIAVDDLALRGQLGRAGQSLGWAQHNAGKMRPATLEELAKYGFAPNAPYMVDGMGQLHLIEGADDYTAAGRARSSATVPGFPAPTTVTENLPAGVIGTYARGDENTIEAARKAAATSRERATLTGQFVDKAEGYLAQGEGFFNDLGQVFSMRTSGLNQLTNKLGPQSRPENSGSTSDKDMGIYMQSTVNVNNTPGTNKDIAAMEAAIAERDAAYLQWVQDYSAAYPSPGSTRDAKRLWDQYTYAEENQMFSVGENGRVVVKKPPAITEWLAQQEEAKAAKAAPVNITTDEEYDALPTGTVYVGPDGVRRTK